MVLQRWGVPTIEELLTDLDHATAALLSDLDGLTGREAREPSCCPAGAAGTC